jgi:hypothetical protein
MALSPQVNYTDWSTATRRRNLVLTFVDIGVSRGQRGGSPTVINLSFLDRIWKNTGLNVSAVWNGWKTPDKQLAFRMASSGMLCRVALVRTDVSEELSASFIRVTRIGELGKTLAVTCNRRTMPFFLVTAVKTSNLKRLAFSPKLGAGRYMLRLQFVYTWHPVFTGL